MVNAGRFPYVGIHVEPPQSGGGGTPSDTVVGELSFGLTSAAGTSTQFARADHTHGTPSAAGTTHYYELASTYTAVTSSLVNACISTADWRTSSAILSSNFLGMNGAAGDSLAVSTAFVPSTGTSTASVAATIRSTSAGSAFYWSNPAGNENWSPTRYVEFSFLHDPDDGGEYEIFEFAVSSSTAFASPHTTWKMPPLAISVTSKSTSSTRPEYPQIVRWHTVSFRIADNTQVGSIGIRGMGLTTRTGAQNNFRIANFKKRALTERERAMEATSTAEILVPPGYTPSVAQSYVHLQSDDYITDLTSPIRVTSNVNGVKYVRSYYISDTGALVHFPLAHFFLNIVQKGDYIEFPPNKGYNWGYSWPLMLAGSSYDDITVDWKGSYLYAPASAITTGYVNADAYINIGPLAASWLGAPNRFTMQNGGVYGWPRVGVTTMSFSGSASVSYWTSITGASTNAAGVVLDNQDEEARSGFDYQAVFPQASDTGTFTGDFQYAISVVTSASAAVANDLELSIKDEVGNVLTSTTVNTALTPSTHLLLVDTKGKDLGYRIAVYAKKLTATANTIVLTGTNRWGYIQYEGAYEFQSGIKVDSRGDLSSGNSTRVPTQITLRNMRVEGVGGDAIQQNGDIQDLRVEGCYSRGAKRQGFSFQNGKNVYFINNTSREPGRSCLDVEPTSIQRIDNVQIIGNRFLNPGRSFQAMSMNSTRMHNIQVVGNTVAGSDANNNLIVIKGEHFLVSGNLMSNYWGGSTATSYRLPNFINIGAGAQDGLVIGNFGRGKIDVAGNNITIALNRIVSSGSSVKFKDEGTDNTWWFNVQMSSGGPTTASITFFGQVNVSSATNPTIVGMMPIGAQTGWAPDTFKGAAVMGKGLWFSGGLDMKGEGVYKLRGLSGSTRLVNNFVFTLTPAAGTTSMVVTFPAQAGNIRPSGFTLTATNTGGTTAGDVGSTASSNGSTAAAGTGISPAFASTGEYFYRVAGNNYFGPTSAIAQATVTVSSAGSVIRIRINDLLDPSSSRFVNGFTIYRGLLTGTATAICHFTPTILNKEFASLRQDVTDIYDFGTNMMTQLSADNSWGYATAYAVATGSFSTMPGVDLTGMELSTTYSVFFGAPSTYFGEKIVTGKSSTGFVWHWNGTAASGTDTVPAMIASS